MREHNNRKRTPGRRIQVTPCGKVIFHETPAAIARKTAYVMQRYGVKV